MEGRCIGCGVPLSPGESVFQLAVGTYFAPNITPTLRDVRGEWHPNHYQEHALVSQEQPYVCCRCGEVVETGSYVVYGVIGRKANRPAKRPEQRGYELHLIAHYGCWYKRHRKMNDQDRKRLIEELAKAL